jgi:hypothetical protein
VVIGVIVDEPMIAHQGGTVAAPTFRRIADATLRHLGVVADDPTVGEDLRAHKPAQKPADAKLAAASSSDQQEPLAAATPEAPPEPIAEDQRRVPELLGQTARAAIVGAQRADLQLSLSGSGLVRTQQPEAGAVVAAGSTVTVVLEPPDNGNSRTPATQGAGEGRPPAEAASVDPADVEPEPAQAPAHAAAAEPARAREKRAPRPRATVVAQSEGRDG